MHAPLRPNSTSPDSHVVVTSSTSSSRRAPKSIANRVNFAEATTPKQPQRPPTNVTHNPYSGDLETLEQFFKDENYPAIEAFLECHQDCSPSVKLNISKLVLKQMAALQEHSNPEILKYNTVYLIRIANQYGYDKPCQAAFNTIAFEIFNKDYSNTKCLRKLILNKHHKTLH